MAVCRWQPLGPYGAGLQIGRRSPAELARLFFAIQPQKQRSYESIQLPLSPKVPHISKNRRKQRMQSSLSRLGCHSFKIPTSLALILLLINNCRSLCVSDTHTHTYTDCARPAQTPPVPFSLLTPVLLCTSAICTTLRPASHPASH